MREPPGFGPRYEALDAWRGVACLMVVAHHAGFVLRGDDPAGGSRAEVWARWAAIGLLRWADLGVPLFFVISGYCIAASLDAHRRRGASSLAFLARRARRIYPPYWAALATFAATAWGLDRLGLGRLRGGGHSLEIAPPGRLHLDQWLGNLTLTETWRPRAWGGSPVEVLTRVAWSLCFEEQFYLICFLALLAARGRLHVALAGFTAAVLAFRAFAYDSGSLHYYEGMFLVRWHEFAVGLAVYWRLVAAPARWRRALDAALVGLLAIGLATSYASTSMAAGFGLALIALRRRDEAARAAAWLAPLRACGRRCYSIYLIHLPACTVAAEWLAGTGIFGFWAKALVVVPLVSLVGLGAGWAFFAAVEAHFLNPPADRRPGARPVAGGPPSG